jgi:hypothetical protein
MTDYKPIWRRDRQYRAVCSWRKTTLELEKIEVIVKRITIESDVVTMVKQTN